ncbi:MAG: 5-formyltetrahydrofolate cyclo-ligase [Oscillatoria sp. PMC 1068.18]|nr:5-formyltetrahydrofolate cyclo-ligase [Oscillatoria sp. PMC 1076.18]MEC4988115.1 5-formyltetrahydrofolate cyclo-ligase [Oscillatoria sp. PMC 1068.18]
MKLQSNKTELRRQFLKKRLSFSTKECEEKSEKICTHLQFSPLFTQAKTILAYFSFRSEPNLNFLFTNSEKTWGLPRCVDKSLFWHSWQPGEPLKKGNFGIFEPDADLPRIQPNLVDLILVPAIACDYRGYRLGYGGGFYDRMLSDPKWQTKPTIGIIYDFAFLPQLPNDPWDKPLNAVCTETGVKLVTGE